MSCKNRDSIASIRYLMDKFPCVVILGARQVGKSTLLHTLLPDAPFFDLERERDLSRISYDVGHFLDEHAGPVIFDEAQLYPPLFSALRVKIDQNRSLNGQYLLSGSSSPLLLHNISESLAGRIAIIELGTFQWSESWDVPISKFYRLISEQKLLDLPALQSSLSLDQLMLSCFHGGYPQPFLSRQDPVFCDLWMQNYFSTYLHRDVRRLFPKLNDEAFSRFIKMLAFSSGQIIKFSDFSRALGVSEPTVKSYFEIAEGTFFWRKIPSYEKSQKKRLVKTPRGYIRDSGLIISLLEIPTVELLRSHPHFGYIWESFVMEQLIKGFQSQLIRIKYSYYRTHNQAEIDLILEGAFGCVPIEIKAGSLARPQSLRALQEFILDYDCPIGILVNQAEEIAWVAPKILQIPAQFL